ncbi:RNase H-like domain found in reverse transcriptase [Popillia japonica]|uniref:RNA-directed DNA polymerase n=1 Tax=Popillia japonica TaxID=7064 RepID=A0AAW1LZF7_POPJA
MIYVDDILIPTETIEENLEILKQVLTLLVQNRLTLRIDQCRFLANKITHLGYEIENSQVRPSGEHTLAITNYPQSRTTRELQSFIGLDSYFRKFVRNFAVIAKPLYDVKRNVDFYFGPEQTLAFNTIKNKLSEQPVLSIYSPTAETQLHCDASALGFAGILLQKQNDGKFLAETQLHCDASALGFAGILLQKQNDGKFHPISYFSQRTTKAESKLHSFELEMLGIVHRLNRFRTYLHGISFKIITDCNSLNLAMEKKDINPRIMRWSLVLQNYNYEKKDINPRIMRWSLVLQNYNYSLEHKRGNLMQHVDALSRPQCSYNRREHTWE